MAEHSEGQHCEENIVKPILKWAGGKRKLLSSIMKLFPPTAEIKTYHEPFLGGGAVFFELKPMHGSINDINADLMNFYRVVRDHPEELIIQAKEYFYEKEAYYKIRDRYNQSDVPKLERAAILLYLNKTAFNGLYRVNSKGKFNVPFGRYKNPKIVPEERIRKASKVLEGVEIFNDDFSYIVDYAKQGDFCYFDPPYQPVSDTANFTSYSVNGFDLDEQKRLKDVCLKLDKKGVKFVLSNSYASAVRELYDNIENFKLTTVQAPRAISSKASTRGLIKEILVTNGFSK